MLALLPALYLGWGVGANDAANTFGPQIGAGVIAFRRAVVLAAIFACLGAVVEGQKVFGTVGGLTRLRPQTAAVATLAAGVSVHTMTALGLPISTSHAIVGALVAVGTTAPTGIHRGILARLIASMVTAPVGAGAIAYLLYRLLAVLQQARGLDARLFDRLVRVTAVLVGCYAAYALGSNNVGNAMAPAVAAGVLSPAAGAALGGAAIAAGVLTFSRRVILLVGNQITALDPASALVAASATALTTHLFTQLGVPVSTSQAMVGAVVGVGLTKGIVAVNRRIFWLVPAGWLVSIAAAAGVTYAGLGVLALLR
ncbi:MAG: anion permease [Armatimonadota bacterium]|nr:anion permease [Armatimonadota bacterium]MDR7532711.1 anion permease [Armatimonadota bacterium]MDR7536362.1 anion permease [Armatimonadota bacterium]